MVAARTTLRAFALAALCWGPACATGQPHILAPWKPAWLEHAGDVRRYMCSEEFAAVTRAGRDRDAVDSLFAHALIISGHDVTDALLSTTVACFDHSTIHVRLGIVTLPFPLSIIDDSIFQCARAHLPKHIFVDSPPEGDADKLQHFFGSAFLQWSTNSRQATDIVARGIELLEPALIVGGVDDPRDIRADKAGQAFAILFDSHYYVAPSVILGMVR